MASNRTVKVGEFAAAVNACLKEYSEAATAKTKAAVKKDGRQRRRSTHLHLCEPADTRAPGVPRLRLRTT